MAISFASLKQKSSPSPPRQMIYGPHGIGKTSLAAGSPAPMFLQTEDGLGIIPPEIAPSFGILRSYAEIGEAIAALRNESHDRQNVVVDTLDHLEPIIWREACARNGWNSIEDPGYGAGYTAALDVWRELLMGFDILRTERNMGVIYLAHATINTFKSPETEPYDRYSPKLHVSNKGIGANPLVQEQVDNVLFCNWRASVVNDKTSNNKKDVGHNRGVGGGSRVVYTQERPAFLAKNRYGMPASIELPDNPAEAWGAVARYLPFYTQGQPVNSAAEAA